jgi:uncharacterized Tic20 family protein
MSTSDLLVTPVQRDRAVEILKEMYADERLTRLEFDQRLDQALNARTRAELNAAFQGVVSRPVPTFLPASYGPPAHYAQPGHYVQPRDGGGRVAGTFAHWLGYPTFFVGPAIVAASAGQKNPAVRRHAIEAVNFQLTVLLTFVALGITTAAVGDWMVFLFPLVGVAWFFLTGLAGLATLVGSNFRYPFTLRFLR